MKNITIIITLFFAFVLLQSHDSSISQTILRDDYACIPCGQDCDNISSSKEGTCKSCNMELVKRSGIIHKNVSPADLYAYVAKKGFKNVIFLDVRSTGEFNGTAEEKFGRLRNAINIPVQDLQVRMNELAPYKNKEIIVYCSHSHRSPRASYILTQNGFATVTNLSEGMHIWKEKVKDQLSNDKLYVAQ